MLKIVVMKVFLGLFCGLVAAIMFGLLRRMSKEDDALYLMAGKEWEDWAERVPFKLFPSIYCLGCCFFLFMLNYLFILFTHILDCTPLQLMTNTLLTLLS